MQTQITNPVFIQNYFEMPVGIIAYFEMEYGQTTFHLANGQVVSQNNFLVGQTQ
jgi:hypothetical protein